MTGVDDFSIYWPGRHKLGPGVNFSKITDLGNDWGISYWALGQSGYIFEKVLVPNLDQKSISEKSVLFHMKDGISLRYFVNACLWKRFFDSNSPQTPSNLTYLTILINLKSFTMF